MSLSYAVGKPDEEWGEKLSEGIYIMNRKKRSVDKSKLLLGSGDVRLYPDEIKRLRRCLDSLKNSNRLLRQGLESDPEEVEYSLAIRENLEIEKGMEGQIKDMEDELRAKGFASMIETPEPCTQHLLNDDDDDDDDDDTPAAAAAAAPEDNETAEEKTAPTPADSIEASYVSPFAEQKKKEEKEETAEAAAEGHADPEDPDQVFL